MESYASLLRSMLGSFKEHRPRPRYQRWSGAVCCIERLFKEVYINSRVK